MFGFATKKLSNGVKRSNGESVLHINVNNVLYGHIKMDKMETFCGCAHGINCLDPG